MYCTCLSNNKFWIIKFADKDLKKVDFKAINGLATLIAKSMYTNMQAVMIVYFDLCRNLQLSILIKLI